MATTSTDVYWSKDFTLAAGSQVAMLYQIGQTEFTATPEPPHECETIQRLSEMYHGLVRDGLI
jgi:hypothetical protein